MLEGFLEFVFGMTGGSFTPGGEGGEPQPFSKVSRPLSIRNLPVPGLLMKVADPYFQ